MVAIVGMGGLGKTTLAKLIYDDEVVSRTLDKKMWVCVSENFDVVQLTKDILKAFAMTDCEDFCQLDMHQAELSKSVEGNRFLLVLDDVWKEYMEPWDTLFVPLLSTATLGSRVLVTTRNIYPTANIMLASELHRLGFLSNDTCRLIFHDIALNGRPEGQIDVEERKAIGNQIVEKCKGLALAVVTMGGLLSQEDDASKWKQVLESDMWDLEAIKNEVIRPLKLSYLYLPSRLKPCFAYISVFPKGHPVIHIVYQWIARDFLQGKSAMDLGFLYISQMISRSLLYEKLGDPDMIEFHDAIHSLAEDISNKECPKIIQKSILKILDETAEVDESERLYNLTQLDDLLMVRSFVSSSYPLVKMSTMNLKKILPHMKNL